MRQNNTQKQTDTWSELEVAVGYISQQQSWHQRFDALLFWTSITKTHKLGSSSAETLSKQENPCNEAWCQSHLPTMPLKCNDSISDMHSAPIQRPHFVDASTHIRRSPLSFRIGIHCRVNLQSCKCHSPQRRMGSFIPPIASSASCTKQYYFGGWHPFRNWKTSHSSICT